MQAIRKTPGVYVTELSAFPPSIVGVETAVPAFIGYTEKAERDRKNVHLKPVKISSLADYEEIFGKGLPPKFTITTTAISALAVSGPTPEPGEEVVAPQAESTASEEGTVEAGADDELEQNTDTASTNTLLVTTTGKYTLARTGAAYKLYLSLKLFYANGGGACYVVSVGDYNSGVKEDDLSKGLTAIEEEVGPTMLVVPDAVLLSDGDFYTLATKMLAQCGQLKDRVAILDVHGSDKVTNGTELSTRTKAVRDKLASNLSYGIVYLPHLETTTSSTEEITYKNITNEIVLKSILTTECMRLYGSGSERAQAVQSNLIDKFANASNVKEMNQNLVAALPLLLDIEREIAKQVNVLPACGAMAGIITYTDSTRGVWNAPANVALSSVSKPTYLIDDKEQEDLNLPVDGKAVNAIRYFPGQGVVPWGARTLDGNSNDYRYIQVRRTLIYIEQSIKAALQQFVFAANDGNTWATVVGMISAFLQDVWSRGGLMGAKASEAFTVQCGLGSTMTGKDVLNGYMIVQVTLQMIRPAEFIELTFKQKMEGVG